MDNKIKRKLLAFGLLINNDLFESLLSEHVELYLE